MSARVVCLYVVGAPADTIRHRFGTYVDWFASLAAPHEVDMRVVDGTTGYIPALDGVDGVVITGSPASLTAPEPWMEAGVELCREAYRRRVPLLGVCFGHQLMGAAFGGSVVANPEGWQLSTARVTVNDDARGDPLFDGLPAEIEVNLSHRDVVRADTLAAQNGVRVLAANAKAPVSAIAAGPHLRGVQFHPEFTGDIVRAYIDVRRDILIDDAASRQAPHDHPDQTTPGVRDCPMGEQVFHNFLRHFVRAERAAPSGARPGSRQDSAPPG